MPKIGGTTLKIIIGAATVATGLLNLINDWAHKQRDEEEFEERFNEMFDKRITKIQEVEYEEFETEEETA